MKKKKKRKARMEDRHSDLHAGTRGQRPPLLLVKKKKQHASMCSTRSSACRSLKATHTFHSGVVANTLERHQQEDESVVPPPPPPPPPLFLLVKQCSGFPFFFSLLSRDATHECETLIATKHKLLFPLRSSLVISEAWRQLTSQLVHVYNNVDFDKGKHNQQRLLTYSSLCLQEKKSKWEKAAS